MSLPSGMTLLIGTTCVSLLRRNGIRLKTLAYSAESADNLLAPVGSQEVWAAGVTYHSSRLARMEESQDSGGGDFYSRVYQADRPEIFLKATAKQGGRAWRFFPDSPRFKLGCART